MRETAPVRAEDASGVGLVHQEHRAVAVLEFDDLGEGGTVAVHAEDGLGQDEHAGVGMFAARPLEMVFEAGEGVVRVDAQDRAARPGGVDEAGVAEFIQDEDIVPVGERPMTPEAAA